ncbi:hypothetical protein BJV74DRAFT_888651 [Russula compacta]|nr:hypothetical protein BJV74DRAFT_888651 [Russula compacta]
MPSEWFLAPVMEESDSNDAIPTSRHVPDANFDSEDNGGGYKTNSTSYQTSLKEIDYGELIDSDVDCDLEGKDPFYLHDAFNTEFGPEGPQAVFDDDDTEFLPHKTQAECGPSKSTALGLARSHCHKANDFEVKAPLGTNAKQSLNQQVKHNFDHLDNETSLAVSKNWPPEACIVINSMTGKIGLKEQHKKLEHVILGSIKNFVKYALFVNAYPSVATCTETIQDCLFDAAIDLKAKVIKMHIKEDKEFVHCLQDLVLAHVGGIYSSAKDTAVKSVTTGYGLNGLDVHQIARCVEKLLEEEQYIFPKVNGQLDFNNPFHHQVIISVLYDDIFQKASSFANVDPDLFASSHESHPEPELPDAIIALAATATADDSA